MATIGPVGSGGPDGAGRADRIGVAQAVDGAVGVGDPQPLLGRGGDHADHGRRRALGGPGDGSEAAVVDDAARGRHRPVAAHRRHRHHRPGRRSSPARWVSSSPTRWWARWWRSRRCRRRRPPARPARGRPRRARPRRRRPPAAAAIPGPGVSPSARGRERRWRGRRPNSSQLWKRSAGALANALAQHGVEAGAELGVLAARSGRLLAQVSLADQLGRAARRAERRPAREALEGQAAEAVGVGAGVERAALRAARARRSRRWRRRPLGPGVHADAEVDQRDVEGTPDGGRQQHVGGLHVPVHEAGVAGRADGGGELAHDGQGVAHRQRPEGEAVGQLLADDERHDEDELAVDAGRRRRPERCPGGGSGPWRWPRAGTARAARGRWPSPPSAP